MHKKALGVLAVAIVVAIVLTIMVGFGGGIDRRTAAVAAAEIRNMEDADATLARERATLDRQLEAEPALFAADGSDERWNAAFQRAGAELAALREGDFAEMQRLVETADSENSAAVQRLAAQVSARRTAIMAEIGGITSDAARIVAFKKEMPEAIAAAEAAVERVLSMDLTGVTREVAAAQADWPEQRADLEERLEGIRRSLEDVQRIWQETADARQRALADEASPADVRLLADRMREVERLAAATVSAPADLGGLIDQLYVAWDQILTDVLIEEGAEVRFTAVYKRVYSRAEEPPAAVAMLERTGEPRGHRVVLARQPESANGKAVWEEPLPPEPITKQDFERLKTNIGMSVAHKPAGKFDHEAEQLLQPAGYAYMAPPGESNRYGRWENRNGSSIWVWYGQYALMRDLFWGPRWRVDRNDWSSYNRARTSGRTYYGDGKYGSMGTATQSGYSSSRYVSTGGFRDSKYVQSGGTYRGSRYESRSAASGSGSRSSYRSGGFSRSGSRSFGK